MNGKKSADVAGEEKVSGNQPYNPSGDPTARFEDMVFQASINLGERETDSLAEPDFGDEDLAEWTRSSITFRFRRDSSR